MKELNSIPEFLLNLSEQDRLYIEHLCAVYQIIPDQNIFDLIDDFVYNHRWEIFMHHTDTELIFETEDVENFIEWMN